MHEQNFIFKDTTMGSMIPKEMKYNLYYGDVRGDQDACVSLNKYTNDPMMYATSVFPHKQGHHFPNWNDLKIYGTLVNPPAYAPPSKSKMFLSYGTSLKKK